MKKHSLLFLIAILVAASCGRKENNPEKKFEDIQGFSVDKLPDNAGVSVTIHPHSTINVFGSFRHNEMKKLTITSPLDTTTWNYSEKTKLRKEIENNSSNPITVLIKAAITEKEGNNVNFKSIRLDDIPNSYIISFENIIRDKPDFLATATNANIALIIMGNKINQDE